MNINHQTILNSLKYNNNTSINNTINLLYYYYYFTNYNITNSISFTLINVTELDYEIYNPNINYSLHLNEYLKSNNKLNFPTFAKNIKHPDFIFIPNKIKRNLEKEFKIKDLKKIDKDIIVAQEMCLYFCSFLLNAFGKDEIQDDWHSFSSVWLENIFGKEVYRRIIDILQVGIINKKGLQEHVIEVNESYSADNHITKKYKLGPAYLNKGIKKHKLQTKRIMDINRKSYYSQLNEANNNIIGHNLLELYSHIELPTQEDIIKQAKKLVKEKYKTKKGKKLIFLNKTKKETRWTEEELKGLSFVEEHIELYNNLTKDNEFIIPSKCRIESGGRITDSFNLMPSWIRNMITIDGEEIEEVDFTCLHPNIATFIYDGDSKYITHKKIAERLNIDEKKVKTEHLSFFNKKFPDMYISPIFNYYYSEEQKMLEKISFDKSTIEILKTKQHTSTTIRMFNAEVTIMTECIKRLNKMGIYVGYVFDALFCKKSQSNKVKEVMDKVMLEAGIYTTAKIG